MKLLFIGAPTLECSLYVRNTLAQHPLLCCPQPLNLISAQSEALQSFDEMQPFLKEYQLFEEDYVNLFRQIIIKTLQNYPHPQNSSVLVETSHQNHLSFTTLYRLFPEAQFSFILRDGRDEVISLLKNKICQDSEITPEDITNTSIEWLNSIGSGLHNLQNILNQMDYLNDTPW